MITAVETYRSAEEAARALGGGGAIYLAGGTLVMAEVNANRTPPRLVRTIDPGLRQIVASSETIRLGAGVTMAQILASRDCAVLHDVARQIGGPQVRSMATVGGNLFARHPYGDLAVALLALGARVALAGQTSLRSLADLLRDRERPALVTQIEVPRPRGDRAFGFVKIARIHPRGASLLSIAAFLPREGSRMRGVRIAYGGMADRPIQAAAVERALEGAVLDEGTIARAVAVAAQGLEPPTDSLASAWYRREVVGVHLRRLLERLSRP